MQPYLEASRRYGGGFGTLLWASAHTQKLRFEALTRLVDFRDKTVLDVGAGRGDLLEHLLERGIRPGHYYALEGVEALAEAVEQRKWADCTVVRADFVTEPQRMFVGAEVVVFSGSLNTLEPELAFEVLRRAYDAAGESLVFNFLSAPTLAAAKHLHWHTQEAMGEFVAGLSGEAIWLEDYLEGDCSVCVR